MSNILSLNSGDGWNYSDPTKPNYMPSITGTVVEVNEVQAFNYITKKPEFWDDGNAKLNIELVIQGQSGKELSWQFSPTKTSVGFGAVRSALKAYNPSANSVADIGGLLVKITTWGETKDYNVNNPRPWTVEILGVGNVEFRGVHEFVQNHAQPQQPQSQPQPQQPNYQQQQNMAMYGQPTPPTPLQRDINGAPAQQAQQIPDYTTMVPTQSNNDLLYEDIPF